MRVFFYLLLVTFLVGTSPTVAQSGPEPPPSALPVLNCTTPSAIEAVICGDPELQARDRMMAKLFEAVRVDAFKSGLSAEETIQRRWLTARDERCLKEPQIACPSGSYDARLNELAVAALFRLPDTALEELRRQDPKTAPLYEAIYRYATIDGQAQRVAAVERLIAPTFDEIHESFKGGIPPFANLQTVEAAAASDEAFSIFFSLPRR
jgi:uncharacterized protein